MECRELTELALGRLLGEADAGRRGDLERHLAGCTECRTELAAIEETWETLGADLDAPVTPEFRARTTELLEDEVARRRIREFRPRSRARRVLAQAAAILVAAAAGFFAAKGGVGPGSKSAAPAADSASGGHAAPSWPDLAENPRLSNVSYKTAADGRVGIDFEATTRHSITGRPDDPRVSSLLAYLLSANETSGEKSRAIELVSENYGPGAAVASPEIVRALAGTLKRDRNPGVRKKAAEALASFRSTGEIRAALLDALANDPNPGVRLVAVDALAAAAKESPDPKTIQSLREKAFDPAENGFVRARAASALKAIDL
jgi:HEAT repeat protein